MRHNYEIGEQNNKYNHQEVIRINTYFEIKHKLLNL